MKKYILCLILLTGLFTLLVGCDYDDDDDENDDCQMPPLDCELMPPTGGSVTITVSRGYSVTVELFSGQIGDSATKIDEYVISEGSISIDRMEEGEYSARAYYTIEGKNVTVTEGDDIIIDYETYCGGIMCWDVKNAEIDVKLDVNAFKDYLEGREDNCFIASAAFGSISERHVKILRLFRDRVLLKTSTGNEFVNFYYHYSPPIAGVVSGSELLKSCIRGVLYPVTVLIEYIYPEISSDSL
ncbi:MAG: hypothetical protein PF637_09620 [Spirochaetes bacterium]|nr:hypothetical protein [Spirochaetota bacterium]